MSSGVLAEILGPDGLIIIGILVIVLLFGGSKLPKLARSLGGASHEFKSAAEEFKRAAEEPHAAALPEPAATDSVAAEAVATPQTHR